MDAIEGLTGVILGFAIFRFFSLPESKLNTKLPKVRLFFVQLFPRFKIRLNKYFLHVHHWMLLSAVLAVLTLTSSFAHLLIIKTLCLGGIIQGITYKDRFSLIEDTFEHFKSLAARKQANDPKS